MKIIIVTLGFYFMCIYCVLAQSPEISLREFASGQIKKGVRSIGMGGDGATWGNYSQVWKDSGTGIMDAGITGYPNSNTFSFTAVGFTSPSLWRHLAIYVIALSQNATGINTSLKSPMAGSHSILYNGNGSNQAVFLKAAMPFSNGFSVGLLLSYERSMFNAVSSDIPLDYVHYQTNWLPSGGFGVTWQPTQRVLVGARALFNHDWEERTDDNSTYRGLNLSYEYRAGISVVTWKGALIDIGGNLRYRYNQIYNTSHSDPRPNIGFEQNILNRHLALRAGLDESSETGGLSVRFKPFILDIAYVHNLGFARIGSLYGVNSNSLIATLVFDYEQYGKKKI